MKRLTILLTLIVCLCGCKETPYTTSYDYVFSHLYGKWLDVTDTHNGTESDSATYYTFNGDGTCIYYSVDAVSGEEVTETYTYSHSLKDGLTIIKDKSDASKNPNYIVIKLYEKEMIWQTTALDLSTSEPNFSYIYWSKVEE